MRGIDRFSKCFVAFVLTAGLGLGGCGAQNPATRNETGKESASDSSVSQQPGKEEEITYIARNEKYGLQLPDADAFGEIFKNFIYWDYATQIEKHDDKLELEGNILGHLKAMKLLDREVKIRLYYRECNIEDMVGDSGEAHFYHVVVGFPELKDSDDWSWLSMRYSAGGLSSAYGWEHSEWWLEDEFQDISLEKLERKKKFKKYYTCMGATSVVVSEEKADAYQPEDRFAAGEKDEILAEIETAVKNEYREVEDTLLFIHDFLPGDFNLTGREVDLTGKGEYGRLPACSIETIIDYSGDKSERFDGIHWCTGEELARPSTHRMKRKEWAKCRAEEMDAEKCILAYHIKDGKVMGINTHSPVLADKEEVLGPNDYSSVLTEKKVREQLYIPAEADITIRYGKEPDWKRSFGCRIIPVNVYEKGKSVAGGFFCISDGSAGCNLSAYEATGK